jgi:hypothetical protein
MPYFIRRERVEAWQWPGDQRGMCLRCRPIPHVHTGHGRIVFLEPGDWIMADGIGFRAMAPGVMANTYFMDGEGGSDAV